MVPSRASRFFSLLPELYPSSSISFHPVYASVEPDGTPGYLPYFSTSDRCSQYSLVTLARSLQRDRQRSHFATTSQGQRSQATLCLSGAGTHHEKVRLYVRSKAREVGIPPAVRFQLESPRATISSSYNQQIFCLRCEAMSWSHGQLIRTLSLRLGSNPLGDSSSLAHEFELCLACFSLSILTRSETRPSPTMIPINFHVVASE